MNILDNPFWHAMTGPQQHHTLGGRRARRYRPELAPQCALESLDTRAFAELATLVAGEEFVGLFTNAPLTELPPGWRKSFEAELLQMVCVAPTPATPHTFVELGETDIEQMLALAQHTDPGPVYPGALALGRFVGIRDGDRLVAMAGERAHPEGFREISGVCTLPEFRGRGYARSLVALLVADQVARGETPFLHVSARNLGAIRSYEAAGFDVRTRLWVTRLKRTTPA